MIDFCYSVVYEGAKEKMPMASVDDPGEYFVPAGQEKQVKWLIPKTNSVYDQFQTGGVPGVGLEASDKGSLASDIDPTKDISPSEQELKVTSFARLSALPNKQLQGDQVAGIVSDKGPLAGEDDPDLLRLFENIVCEMCAIYII